MIAIIQTGGKQYLVAKGDIIQVEKLEGKAGDSLIFDQVLMTGDEKTHTLGKPLLANAKVEAKIVKQGRGDKVVILKYKAKSKYRKKQGHRQSYTEVQITKV